MIIYYSKATSAKDSRPRASYYAGRRRTIRTRTGIL